MRSLPISLLLVTVLAVFGVGIVLDAMYERYIGKTTDSIAQISAFGQGVANMINQAHHPEAIVADWPEHESYSIGLSEKDSLPLPDALQTSFEAGEPVILETEQGVAINYLLSKHDTVLTIYNDQLPTERGDGLAWIFTGIFYLGTLGAVLIWLKPLLNRIRILRQSTKAFGSGDLNSRVTLRGVTYIKDIEEDFNRMADQIQQLIEDNKLLTSAVSHDLRTPLARLRFGIDTLKEESTPIERDQYLYQINSDLDEMESLVDSHLQFARLDNVLTDMEKTTVSLKDLMEECVAQFYDDDVSVKIIVDNLNANDALEISGCIEHLASLFNNLLQNAFKHANNTVQVEMDRNSQTIEINISDDGPGIPEKLREQVMKPFERGGESQVKGYGLGLTVAARIARHHSGHINISDCKMLGGAKVRVLLAATNGCSTKS